MNNDDTICKCGHDKLKHRNPSKNSLNPKLKPCLNLYCTCKQFESNSPKIASMLRNTGEDKSFAQHNNSSPPVFLPLNLEGKHHILPEQVVEALNGLKQEIKDFPFSDCFDEQTAIKIINKWFKVK